MTVSSRWVYLLKDMTFCPGGFLFFAAGRIIPARMGKITSRPREKASVFKR